MRPLPFHGATPFREVGTVALLVALFAAPPAWADGPGLSPDAAVGAALDVHPQIQVAEAELARARGASAESAWVLLNPHLSVESTLDGERTGLEASLPVSLSGAGWHGRARSAAALDAAEAELRRARLAVAAEIRRTYAQAAVASGRARVAGEGVELATRLGQAVIRLEQEGEASALDVRLARLAEVQAAAGLLAARETEAALLQDLAARIARPVSPSELLSDPLAAAPSPSAESPAERADIVAARERQRAAELDLRLQRASALPPVHLGVFAEAEEGQTWFGPTVGVELPVFRRNQAGRAGALAQVQVAEADVASVVARAETEAATAQARVDEARSLDEVLIADPAAEARAALASIEAGYRAGEIDLPSAVLLQAEVLDGEGAAIELLGRVAVARIDLLLATEDPALLGGGR